MYLLKLIGCIRVSLIHERTIKLRMNPRGGFVVTERNRNVTNTIFDGMYLAGGSFRPGFVDYNIPTEYEIKSFSIRNLAITDLYHPLLNPTKIGPMLESSLVIQIDFLIKNMSIFKES